MGLLEEAAMAALIQAKFLFGHVQLPKTDRLWAEAMHWACEALNHTACSANPDCKSPYEMWYGEPRPARRICFGSRRNASGSDRLSCYRRVRVAFMSVLRETTRVIVIEYLRGPVSYTHLTLPTILLV